MKSTYQLLIAGVLSCFFAISVHAQSAVNEADSVDEFAHCSLFYATSSKLNILPFDDVCFVRDRYLMHDYKHIRVFGPIDGSMDLFKKYDWSFNFYLSAVTGDGKMALATPQNMLDPQAEVKEGEVYFTISDNRNATEFGRDSDHVDYVPVSGKFKITDFEPQTAAQEYPYFNVQVDVALRKVDRTGGGARLTGPEISFKSILIVQEME